MTMADNRKIQQLTGFIYCGGKLRAKYPGFGGIFHDDTNLLEPALDYPTSQLA